MKRRAIFNVVEFVNSTGTTSWRVSGTKAGGERVRRNFLTQAEALGEKQRLELEAANVDVATALKSTRLTNEQLRDAESAFAELNGRPILPAIRFYLENYKEPITRKSVKDALDEFIGAKRKANKRERTVKDLESRVGLLVKQCGEKKAVADVQPSDVEAVVFRADTSPVNQHNCRRAISRFFRWSVLKGYAASNPVDKVERLELDQVEPACLTVGEVRLLMETARTFKRGRLVPYITLAMFAAIRPAELERLSWKDADFETKTVTITGAQAKMRQRRIVELSDNAVDWLLPHAAKRTPIKGKNWRRDFDALKLSIGYAARKAVSKGKRGKLKQWPQDVLRHTGISNHLAHHEHEGKTAVWAGNSPVIVQKHYKGLIKKTDAEAFWSIRPIDSSAKMVKLKVA